MMTVRPAASRGHVDFGWLDSRHSFSFGSYRDPAHMGFRSLRVINEDRVAPGGGFPPHGHRDMEIISYVLDGALAHRDSLGNETLLRPGEVQVMSAGSGIRHSEYNGNPAAATHFLQIWLLPSVSGTPPRHDQAFFPDSGRRNRWRLLAAPDGSDGALTIGQDARLYGSLLDAGASIRHSLATGRGAWLQVARGQVTVADTTLNAGDGAAFEAVDTITVTATGDAELLLFDLA